jgi:hypothetical protein
LVLFIRIGIGRGQQANEGFGEIQGLLTDLQSLHLKVLDNSVSTISQCWVGFITHDALRDLCARYPASQKPSGARPSSTRLCCADRVVHALNAAVARIQATRMDFGRPRAVLHGSAGNRTEPAPSLCLSDADGLRASELKHAVQSMNCDGDLSSATPIRP